MSRIGMLCLMLPYGVMSAPAASCGHWSVERYEPRTFLGYECEDDCQRHKHGFRWAEQRAVADARSCEPLGSLEAQGCLAYVDESVDPQGAGERWAIENEIADPCLCDGAGEGFWAGCTNAAVIPPVASR